jgi:hypothetical protein
MTKEIRGWKKRGAKKTLVKFYGPFVYRSSADDRFYLGANKEWKKQAVEKNGKTFLLRKIDASYSV